VRRVGLLLVLLIAITVAGWAAAGRATPTPARPSAAPVAARSNSATTSAAASSGPRTPGEDPAVQGWLRSRTAAQVDVDNLLWRTRVALAGSGPQAPAVCGQFRAAVARLRAAGTGPDAEVGRSATAGLSAFDHAAATCQRGDYAAAGAELDRAVAQRSAGQDRLDAVLDGD